MGAFHDDRRRRTAAQDDPVAVAMTTAHDVQETIRHADSKATTLIAVLFGLVTTAAPTLARVRAGPPGGVRAVVMILFVVSVLVAGAHLAAVIWPRISVPAATNRLAFPTLARRGPPPAGRTGDAERDAWALAAHLSTIALHKHRRVRRSLPWIGVAAATALGSLLITALGLLTTGW